MISERLDVVVLAWLWCQKGKGKKLTDIAKPKTGVGAVLPDGSSAEALVADSLERLGGAGEVLRSEPTSKKGGATFAITAAGTQRLLRALGRSEMPAKATFAALLKSDLARIAAGIAAAWPGKMTPAAIATLLQLGLCVHHFRVGIALDQGVDQAKLAIVKLALSRSQSIPLERIYLKKLPSGELPALVVAPLLGLAGTAASKLETLVAAAALQILGISDPKQLGAALVRRWVLGDGAGVGAVKMQTQDVLPARALADLPKFARDVLAAAREVAREGREGLSNLRDKVLIHYCWRRYQQMFGAIEWNQFKECLWQANGSHLVLVREDLIPDARRQEFMESEVRRGPSSYHYIRV